MNWINLTSEEQIKAIKAAKGYSIIFKHSTRCSISMMAKRRFELDGNLFDENTPLYFLDLIKYRELSAKVAETFNVHHESPQLLLIKDGECILNQSHSSISAEEAVEVMQ
ncbi:bacillithiol system redox-active protein YtxJ [Mucilaginibacter arboris]|uniref:Bacillithiol system redox-active protein YtxJ n=1 Tax=Mucilaginibacter arboris TaxID=2682090 RepID=A0A7K1SW28_9SPHI|nr:bacillithiol system redox-active protein YtxJ [Mucilaginibacter arboris]MVN21504.1 bacillithiol system redox-active protein YtxJ [Mucilaginibacter arboris]